MPRDAGKPSVANLRSSAQAVRSAISGQSGAIADALTAIAAALDQVQAAVESLEGKNRELASPDTNDPRRRSTAYVSGDRIIGGISVQGVLPSVAGQSLDLTLADQIGTIVATDHNTGDILPIVLGSKVGTFSVKPTSVITIDGPINGDSQVRITEGGAGSLSLLNYQPGNVYIGFSTDLSGGAWVARSATAFRVYQETGVLQISCNAGLTIGNTFVPVSKIAIDSAGKVGIGTVVPTSPLQVVGYPVYANNAAAVAGGLSAGAHYCTGADPDPVCVVH
jgi:hypothetical protein